MELHAAEAWGLRWSCSIAKSSGNWISARRFAELSTTGVKQGFVALIPLWDEKSANRSTAVSAKGEKK